MTTNAVYSHIDNAVYIPAGLIGKPFYDPSWDERLMLVSVGWIIAHEFSHALPISSEEQACIDMVETALSLSTTQGGRAGVVAAAHRANFTLDENMADHYAMHYIADILRGIDQSAPVMAEAFVLWAQTWCDGDPRTWVPTDSHQSPMLRVNATVEMSFPFTNAFACPQRYPVCLQ